MQEDDLLSFEEHDKSFEEHMQRMSELSCQSEQFTSSQNKLTIGRKRTRIETMTEYLDYRDPTNDIGLLNRNIMKVVSEKRRKT